MLGAVNRSSARSARSTQESRSCGALHWRTRLSPKNRTLVSEHAEIRVGQVGAYVGQGRLQSGILRSWSGSQQAGAGLAAAWRCGGGGNVSFLWSSRCRCAAADGAAAVAGVCVGVGVS